MIGLDFWEASQTSIAPQMYQTASFPATSRWRHEYYISAFHKALVIALYTHTLIYSLYESAQTLFIGCSCLLVQEWNVKMTVLFLCCLPFQESTYMK